MPFALEHSLFCASAPQTHVSHEAWVHHNNLSVKHRKYWVLSVQATISGQAVVYDAVAPPSVRNGSYRAAPRELAYKSKRRKRRHRHGSGSHGSDNGPEWDGGGCGGNGGWGGSDGNGEGGYNFGGSGWNDNDNDGLWWEDASDAVFKFVYEMACWISLSECLQFVLKKLLVMLTLLWKIRQI